MSDFELVFEKDYELLQELKYSSNGNFKSTKKVILKAPTVRNAEKFESALEGGHAKLVKFICDNKLMVAPDNSVIELGDAEALHAIAMVKLAVDYRKFFFDLSFLIAEMEKKD
jgi:hypothetical protein